MGKLSRSIAFLTALFSSASAASACGRFRHGFGMMEPMEMNEFGHYYGFGWFVLISIAILFLFWISMLVDCMKRDFRKDSDKIAWALMLIFLNLIGALVYYFIVKIPGKKKTPEKKK